jgi:inosine-uridine nucleoside N-ribohydrolase
VVNKNSPAIAIENLRQFVRQSAWFLPAISLILASLPGCTGPQDRSAGGASTAPAAAIVPLDGQVLVGKSVTFRLHGHSSNPHWDLGDGATADGSSVTHTYQNPGVYRVVMGSKVGDTFNELSSAIVRVHTPGTQHLPQVLLDTDAANEIDDQHAIAYTLFSELDVLAITSTGWIKWTDEAQTVLAVSWDSEDRSYREIQKVLELAKRSGLPDERVPMVFRGAKTPLRSVGMTRDRWFDTEPVITDASHAILAAARGASPTHPVWVLPIGTLTNVASALLQVRQQGWEAEFRERIRVCWLGGGRWAASSDTANGNRDPWAPWVTYKSGIEFVMFLERPTGKSITFDEKTDYSLYAGNPLGDYLKKRTEEYIDNKFEPTEDYPLKAMYDMGVVSLVIGTHLGRPWLTRVEPSILLSDEFFTHQPTTQPTNLTLVHEVNAAAMKKDFWDTLNGRPTSLPPKP